MHFQGISVVLPLPNVNPRSLRQPPKGSITVSPNTLAFPFQTQDLIIFNHVSHDKDSAKECRSSGTALECLRPIHLQVFAG